MSAAIKGQLQYFIETTRNGNRLVYLIGLHDNLKAEIGNDLDGMPVAYGEKLPEWMWMIEMTESSVFLFTRNEYDELGILQYTLELQP